MALIKCKACGADISEHAKKCPHCGASVLPIKSAKASHKAKTLLCIGVIVCIIVAAVGVFFLMSRTNEDSLTPKLESLVKTEEDNVVVEITPEFSDKINKYYEVDNFYCGRAAVMDDNYKWGFINTNGDLAIQHQYSGWPNHPKFSDGLALVETEDTKAYIDVNGNEVIKLNKDDIASDFVNDKAVVYSAHKNEDWTFTLSKTFRVINKKGETIAEIPIPTDASLIEDGIGDSYPGAVKVNESGFVVKIKYSYFQFDFQGNNLGELEGDGYGNVAKNPSDFNYFVFTEERGYDDYGTVTLHGIKDKQGNIVVTAKEWRFPEATYDSKSDKYYINPHQGIFIAILAESPYSLGNIDSKRIHEESDEASYYGFVNLKGENTFSEERWERQRVQTYNILNNINTY